MQVIETVLPHTGSFAARSKTDFVVLHHAAAKLASVQQVNSWHNQNGWNGIGYHYYIRKDGSVYRGRPEWALGAHAQGVNDRSIGICCEGDYMVELTMPAAQLSALQALLRDIMRRYGKLPLRRHRDVGSTDCPGDHFPWQQAQQYEETEEDMEMVKQTTVRIDGKDYTVSVIQKGGQNYLRLRDLEQAGYTVTYDAASKTPGLAAPQTRAIVPTLNENTAADAVAVKARFGLSDKTIDYLRRYAYGDELLAKLAAPAAE